MAVAVIWAVPAAKVASLRPREPSALIEEDVGPAVEELLLAGVREQLVGLPVEVLQVQVRVAAGRVRQHGLGAVRHQLVAELARDVVAVLLPHREERRRGPGRGRHASAAEVAPEVLELQGDGRLRAAVDRDRAGDLVRADLPERDVEGASRSSCRRAAAAPRRCRRGPARSWRPRARRRAAWPARAAIAASRSAPWRPRPCRRRCRPTSRGGRSSAGLAARRRAERGGRCRAR